MEREERIEGIERIERIGILGGTFDPPHVAHLHLAVAARDQFDLDRVLLVVAGDPWQKRGEVGADAPARLAMAQAAFAGIPGIEVSDLEIRRSGPTYTADTLEELAAPGRRLHLILGADAAVGLPTWHRPERVRDLADLLIADRPGSTAAEEVVEGLAADGWRADVVRLDHHDVSSTNLRDRLAGGGDVDGALSADVIRVVEERGLYTRP